MAQLDGGGEPVVCVDDRLRAGQRTAFDVAADEVPAVLGMADQRIDEIGAGADVEYAHPRAAWNRAAVARGEKIGQIVQIVGAARDRRAEIAGRNIPGLHAVEVAE